VHDPQAHSYLGVVGRRFGLRISKADRLRADALDPDLGVLASQGRSRFQRSVADGVLVLVVGLLLVVGLRSGHQAAR
jgi:hypothetical protein